MRSVFLAVLVCLAAMLGPRAAVVLADEATQDAIFEALDDERRAMAFYEAVMSVHGERRPFSNIVNAEARHADALLRLCDQLGLEPPRDRWTDAPFEVPARFDDACDLAAAAEIENVAMYDRLFEATDDERALRVFERLRAASQERHLPAFRRHGGGWEVVPLDALTDGQRAQRDRAVAARNAMFQRLLGTLTEEIQRVGVAGAIEVCSDAAPRIAEETAEKWGIGIGRTSWHLRNPKNSPPAWAAGLLASRPDAPLHVGADDGRLGVVTPIFLMPACLQCHGGPDDLAPGVPEALAERYPKDEATGFGPGDLRGWFWMHIPPSPD